jgi:hypothetical protein
MRNQRITDGQAMALLDGRAPEGRDDLQDVAALVSTLRLASFEPPPQPSAALAARLDLDRLAWVSAAQGTGVPAGVTGQSTAGVQRRATSKAKRALGWFTGLGLAAQLALGAGAVSASAAGIGMAGGLPPAAQEVFDTVVATVARADDLLGGASGEAEPEQGADETRTGVDGTGRDAQQTDENGAGTGSTDAAPGGGGASDGPKTPGGAGKPNAGKAEKAEKPAKEEKTEKLQKAEKPEKVANGKDDGDTLPGNRDRIVESVGKGSSAGEGQGKSGSTGSDARDGMGASDTNAADGAQGGRGKDKPATGSAAE